MVYNDYPENTPDMGIYPDVPKMVLSINGATPGSPL